MDRDALRHAEKRLGRECSAYDYRLEPTGRNTIRVTVVESMDLQMTFTVKASRRAGAQEVARLVLAAHRRVLSHGAAPFFRGEMARAEG